MAAADPEGADARACSTSALVVVVVVVTLVCILSPVLPEADCLVPIFCLRCRRTRIPPPDRYSRHSPFFACSTSTICPHAHVPFARAEPSPVVWAA